jgi:HPt (histidine-containing phosphotransfer) domain-containing protein
MKTENQTAFSATDEKLYDLATIEKFCHGNVDEVKEMVIIFIDEVLTLVEDIRAAYSKNDFDGIKKLTHKIKPVIAYYDAVKIQNELQLINILAEQGIPSAIFESKMSTLQSAIEQVVDNMNKTILKG